jgi:adenosylhomocysteine nucleosidase
VRIAILAALPQEVERLKKDFKAVKRRFKHIYDVYFGTYNSLEVLLVITAMGPANARAALDMTCRDYHPDVVVSMGYGGALYEGAEAGELVWASEFVSCLDSGETVYIKQSADDSLISGLAGAVKMKKGTIITVSDIVSKDYLVGQIPSGLPNPVCDMETFGIARHCIEKGIRFFAIRAITDLRYDDIPSALSHISDGTGTVSVLRVLRLVVMKPWLLPVIIYLGINSMKASQNLRIAVKALLGALHGV